MKISTLLFGAAFMFMMASCSETKVEDKSTTTPAATETPAATPAETPENSTEIRIGSDGGEIKTEGGETETEIKVSEDETEIKVKK